MPDLQSLNINYLIHKIESAEAKAKEYKGRVAQIVGKISELERELDIIGAAIDYIEFVGKRLQLLGVNVPQGEYGSRDEVLEGNLNSFLNRKIYVEGSLKRWRNTLLEREGDIAFIEADVERMKKIYSINSLSPFRDGIVIDF